MKLYVGNLPYSITDDSLRALFAPHGEVASASVVMDRASGRSKGFGFVEMPDSGAAATAMQVLPSLPSFTYLRGGSSAARGAVLRRRTCW